MYTQKIKEIKSKIHLINNEIKMYTNLYKFYDGEGDTKIDDLYDALDGEDKAKRSAKFMIVVSKVFKYIEGAFVGISVVAAFLGHPEFLMIPLLASVPCYIMHNQEKKAKKYFKKVNDIEKKIYNYENSFGDRLNKYEAILDELYDKKEKLEKLLYALEQEQRFKEQNASKNVTKNNDGIERI